MSLAVIAVFLSKCYDGATNIRPCGTDRKTSIQALELFFHMSPKVEAQFDKDRCVVAGRRGDMKCFFATAALTDCTTISTYMK